ncbi:MAG: trigger factor [Lachnospiraceae bacterium]|nr:trigger factor [Lachnospiraceae bacterium]
MKKRIVSILLCMTMGLSAAACGAETESSSASVSTESTESTETESTETETDSASASSGGEVEITDVPILDKEEYTLDECIELAEYKGLKFTKTVEPVTDSQILIRISQQTGIEGEELTDPDAAVQEGDVAVIEYEGKKDGVAFEGGTSTEPYELQIGSDTFIDGFEDGIIGMKAGETKDLNLTFPENYGSTELAGADVVFTVTVNSIKRLVIDDAWVEENAGEDFANAEEYLNSFRTVLEEEHESTAQNNLFSDVWNTLRDSSTYLALPKTLVEEAALAYDESAAQQAEMYGYELDDLIEQYGKDLYAEEKAYYAETTVKNTLLRDALLEAEEISADSEDYIRELDELVESVGAESSDELIEAYGQEEVYDMIMKTLVVEKVLSYSEVTEE